ncbi:MAG: hypothetical protein M1817_006817 [Caeruleum heppii]|nr:MAG: hypothetical protein M1817_006817 [Caeruleum heppii]
MLRSSTGKRSQPASTALSDPASIPPSLPTSLWHTTSPQQRRSIPTDRLSNVDPPLFTKIPSTRDTRGSHFPLDVSGPQHRNPHPRIPAVSSSTPPKHQHTESASYYIASWGSPYQRPSSQASSPGTRRRQGQSASTSGDELDVGSSVIGLPLTKPRFGRASRSTPSVQASALSKPIPSRPSIRSFASDLDRGARFESVGNSTDAWVRTQFLGRSASERQNWWSDESTEEETQVPRLRSAVGDLNSSGHKTWLETRDDSEGDEAATPTLRKLLGHDRSQHNGAHAKKPSLRRYSSRLSVDTIKQEDFGVFPERKTHPQRAVMLESKYADSVPSQHADQTSVESKAAPGTVRPDSPPPTERKEPSSPPRRDETSAAKTAKNVTPPTTSHGTSRALSGQSPKKRVIWKGKSCIIALPRTEARDQHGAPLCPLSSEEVRNRIERWGEKGYDTRGFGYWGARDVSSGGEGMGQSRRIFPDAAEIRQDSARAGYRVSIPDRKDWEAYVNFLKEETLRKLGVSTGDEGTDALASSSVTAMSRQTSSHHPTMAISPPAGTSSAASNHTSHHPNLFSPSFLPANSTTPSSQVTSVASPGPANAQMFGLSKSRQSISLAGDQRLVSPFQQPLSPLTGGWAPQHVAAQPSMHPSRAAVARVDSRAGVRASPVPSPYIVEAREGQAGDYAFPSVDRRQQSVEGLAAKAISPAQKQKLEGGQGQSEAPVPGSSRAPITTSIVSPLPRGHRYNLSETLQQSIEDAERHLEDSDRQLQAEDNSREDATSPFDTGDLLLERSEHTTPQQPKPAPQKFPSKSITVVEAEGGQQNIPAQPRFNPTSYQPELQSAGGPPLHHPQPHNRVHSLSQSSLSGLSGSRVNAPSWRHATGPTLASEAETALNGPTGHQDVASNGLLSKSKESIQPGGPTLVATDRIGPGSTASRLNVEAKEFRVDPKNSFASINFSFGGTGAQPASFTPLSFGNMQKLTDARVPVKADTGPSSSNLNVEAAAFKPTSVNKTSFPTGSFSFSSNGPAFHPRGSDAITKVNADKDQATLALVKESPDDKNRIFNITDIVKPTKQSKAIPIVRPDSATNENIDDRDDEAQEDESGRITQGEARRKRTRHIGGDGDSIPQFAVPAHPLTESGFAPADRSESSLHRDEGGAHGNSPQPDRIRNERQPADRRPEEVDDLDSSKVSDRNVSTEKPSLQPDAEKDFMEGTTEISPTPNADASIIRSEHLPNDLEVTAAKDLSGVKMPVNGDSPEATMKDARDSSLSATAPAFVFPLGAHASKTAMTVNTDEVGAAGAQAGGLEKPRFAKSAPSRNSEVEVEGSESDSDVLHGNGFTISTSQEAIVEENKNQSGQMENLTGVDSTAASIRQSSPVSAGMSSDEVDASQPTQNSAPLLIGQTEQASSIYKLPPRPTSRSDAPSPSPRRTQVTSSLHERGTSPTLLDQSGITDSKARALAGPGVVHRLHAAGEDQTSDWDDVLSSSELPKLEARSHFFDNHVDDVVGGLLESRLGPLERSLSVIQDSLRKMALRRSSRTGSEGFVRTAAVGSDADDEEDDEDDAQVSLSRPKSPRRDPKLEKIKAIVVEALGHQQPKQIMTAPAYDLSQIVEDLTALKSSLQERLRGSKGSPTRPTEKEPRIAALMSTVDKLGQEIDGERRNCRAAEDNLIETQKLLRIAQAEEERLREATETGARISSAAEAQSKQDQMQMQSLRNDLSEVVKRCSTLETEVRDASARAETWRGQTEQLAKQKDDVFRTVEVLRCQMEESVRVREGLRARYDKLQDSMTRASASIAQEQSSWRRRVQDHQTRNEKLSAHLDAEAKTRERLEREIERLETQEREGMRMRYQVEHVQKINLKLEDVINRLRGENLDHQKNTARLEGEYIQAREAGRVEVHRTRLLMQADLDNAHNQVNIVRADLESQVARIQMTLDQVKMEADGFKAKSELLLEEARDAKRDALREASEAHQHAMEEQHRKYEKHLDELRSQHDHALKNVMEDKERVENHLLERLSLSGSTIEQLQEKVIHMDEKLEVARSAAHAAAQAAQSVKGASNASASPKIVTTIRGSDTPDKVSPQALRESILVLQEQLQERESRIETLEQELSAVDREAPSKVTERETEITWLRELLGVRMGDLESIIESLSEPEFDASAVKDAAIRLKANLQMEQQERERAMSGDYPFPSLAKISSYASPRAMLPLAAAFGSWRKGREHSTGNISEQGSAGQETPSRSSPSAQSFLSGLLTPPSTNNRITPRGSGASPARRTMSHNFGTPKPTAQPGSDRRKVRRPSRDGPRTPPLLRKGSYDADADADGTIISGRIEEDDMSTVDGQIEEGRVTEPFGPIIRA